MACVVWIPYAGLTSCITSRDFRVYDQGLYITPNFIKNCFLIGYNIFQLIVSEQLLIQTV